MKRLRTLRIRHWVMPVILAAMAARAFMPAGFMSVADGAGLENRIVMCSQDKARRERLEFPGEQAPAEHRLQCKHCLAPVLGAPFASLLVPAPAPLAALRVPAPEPQPYSPLLRAQEARAPPHA